MAVVAAGGLSAGLLAACGLPAGVDGKLADDWPTVSEPKSFTPESEVCQDADYNESASLSSYQPVDCAKSHRTETIFVGAFTGGAEKLDAPPKSGSDELRAAYGDCDEKARAYLGADFRTGRLWLGVVVPTTKGWAGGSRWYRCDLTEKADNENFGETVQRTGPLKGVLKKTSPLSLTCYQVKAQSSGRIDSRTPIECTRIHNSEFAGVFTAPIDSYPARQADWDQLHGKCRNTIARYVRLPIDSNLKYRTGTVVVPGSKDDWEIGNHGVRCYLYVSGKTFTKSLKGAGPGGLPIQYA